MIVKALYDLLLGRARECTPPARRLAASLAAAAGGRARGGGAAAIIRIMALTAMRI